MQQPSVPKMLTNIILTFVAFVGVINGALLRALIEALIGALLGELLFGELLLGELLLGELLLRALLLEEATSKLKFQIKRFFEKAFLS